MKFITDENLGIRVPQYLRTLGYNVVSVIEVALSKPDTDILDIANKENRIILTTDKDFDESVENKKKVLLRELKSGKDLEGKFTRVRD